MKVITSIVLSLGLVIGVQAQTPANPAAQPVPAPGPPSAAPAQPKAPAVNPATPGQPPVPGLPAGAVPGANPAPAVIATGPDAIAARAGQVIDGSNWDDQDVADEYSKYTGKRVLLSSATQNLEIRFYQRGPLTNREAADLLVKVLDMEGFVFVPSGADEVKLLPKAQGTGANGPAELEGIIDDPNEIPGGDAYISYFMKLGFIKPEEAVRTFTQSIHGLGPGAKIAPVPNASAVLITGKAAFVRKLINQQRYIDVPTGNVATTWVSLKFADSEDVAATLNEIMNAQQQRKTTAGVTTAGTAATRLRQPSVPGVPQRNTGAAATAGGTSAAGEDIPVQIVASPRLNKIFIMGRPVDIVFVEGLAREFDAPPNRNSFVKRKLRFMIASDFLQVAADALEANTASGTSSAQGGNARNTGRQTTQNRRQSTTGNTGGQTGQTSARGGAESVQEFNVTDVPESIVIGKTFIVADNIANSVLVQGPPESIRIVSELLDKLDGRPQQVMISTVFGKITLDNKREVGFNIGQTAKADDANRTSNGAGSSNTGFGALADLTTLTGVSSLSGTGLSLYGRVRDVTAMFKALEANNNFKILSRPTVSTANNRKAVISSGKRIAVPTNTFTSGATTGSTQSTNIEYRDVLLRFEVVPLINSEHEVTLRISLLNEDTQGNQTIDENEIPTIVTESITTTVTVPNNATVVLGGLVTEKYTDDKTGVPILSSIPGIGRLFRSTKKQVERSELLIFIQPKITTSDSDQEEAQSDMERRYKVADPSRDFADGVLPGKPGSRTAKPSKKSSSKGSIPTASKRPSLRYPTRR